jgi:leader peptidase (prepilin peptidase)/N-methyltransferase
LGVIYNALKTNWGALPSVFDSSQITLSDILRISNELNIIDSIFGIIIGGGILYLIGFIYEAIKKREGMGMGDVKLLAMIGAFIGWKGVIFVAFLSSLLGVLVGISVILFRGESLKYAIPFGPFLSFAAAFYCFTGGFGFAL